MRNNKTFFSVKDIAKILGCCEPTARKIMRQPDFPARKIGSQLKVYPAAFEKWCLSKQ